jgi:hypothetical protein
MLPYAIASYKEMDHCRYGWFVAASRVHVRDLGAAAALTDLVREVAATQSGPVTMASVQMGFVPYSALTSSGVCTRVTDFMGLQDRVLTSAYKATHVRDAFSGSVDGDPFFWNLVERGRLPAPEIVYLPIHPPQSAWFWSNYQCAWRQSGTAGTDLLGPGISFNWSQSIYIRNGLKLGQTSAVATLDQTRSQ